MGASQSQILVSAPRDWRIRAIQDGKLFDITDFSRTLNIPYATGVSGGLFRVLFPAAEDANHGETFSERAGNMLAAYRRALPFVVHDTLSFNFKIKTFLRTRAESMPHIQQITGSQAGSDSHGRDIQIEHQTLRHARSRLIWVKAVLGPGDDGITPVITFLLDRETEE